MEWNETDRDILDLLAVGRCRLRYLATELNREQSYISQRLERMVEQDHVKRVDQGLYELREFPEGIHSSISDTESAETG